MNAQLINDALAELQRIHPDGSLSIGITHGHGFTANVHFRGECWVCGGKTASEAFANVIDKFREDIPTPAEAIRRRVERARADLAAAEREALTLSVAA